MVSINGGTSVVYASKYSIKVSIWYLAKLIQLCKV